MNRSRCLVTLIGALVSVFMVVGADTAAAADRKPLIIPALFVQNAEAVVIGEGTLTLKNVSPMTVFFANRPVRIAGHFNTKMSE